jgi:hypothetical protein
MNLLEKGSLMNERKQRMLEVDANQKGTTEYLYSIYPLVYL